MEAYSVLSKVYEYLICDCDYEKWSQYLLQKLKEHLVGVKGIDCACGSGYFTRAIKRCGYDVIGVDFSAQMLDEAVRISAKEGLRIPYLQMDMSKLKSFEKQDFITVINDGLNYLSQDKLKRTFKCFHSVLKKGGVLLFDLSSEYKITSVLANNMFGEDTEDCSYLWFNKLYDDYVDMDIVLFLKDGDKYVKKEENHRQYIHKTEFVKQILLETGFDVLEINEHLGGQVSPTSQRIEFIAKKV